MRLSENVLPRLVLPLFSLSLTVLLSGCMEPDNSASAAFIPNQQPVSATNAVKQTAEPAQTRAGDLSTLVVSLHHRLKQSTPDDIGGWVLLSQTYKALNQPSKAIDALHQGLKANPSNGRLIAALERISGATQGLPAVKRPQHSPMLSPGLNSLLQKRISDGDSGAG